MKTSLLIVTLLLPATTVCGRDVPAGPDNYRTLLSKLKPGDTLILAPGKYTRGMRIRGMHGKPGKPITIQGAGAKTVMVARKGSNTIDLTDASWIVIRNITFDGRNLHNIDAIKAGGDSSKGVHHVTIEGNTIVNHGANQQTVAISTKVPCWDWTIRGNTITAAESLTMRTSTWITWGARSRDSTITAHWPYHTASPSQSDWSLLKCRCD